MVITRDGQLLSVKFLEINMPKNTDQTTSGDDGLLTNSEVAAIFRIDAGVLRRWRVEGTGPSFVKVGRLIRYRPADVTAWLESRNCRSTADYGSEVANHG